MKTTKAELVKLIIEKAIERGAKSKLTSETSRMRAKDAASRVLDEHLLAGVTLWGWLIYPVRRESLAAYAARAVEFAIARHIEAHGRGPGVLAEKETADALAFELMKTAERLVELARRAA